MCHQGQGLESNVEVLTAGLALRVSAGAFTVVLKREATFESQFEPACRALTREEAFPV